MAESKVSLSLLVPGIGLLSSQECKKNPGKSYNEHKVLIEFVKESGKHTKKVKELLNVKTRKQRLITQNINICEEAYNYMLETPTTKKMFKLWPMLSENEKLRAHFDLIAHDLHAVSYSFEILGD